MAAVPILEGENYTRTSGKCFGVERGTSVDAMEIVAVLEQDTLAAMAVDNWIVAVGILVGMEDKRTAGADKSEESTAAGGRLKEDVVTTLTGSLVYRDRPRSVERAVGVFVQATEVGCSWSHSQMDSRIPGQVAKNRPRYGVMGKSQILRCSAVRDQKHKGYVRVWIASVVNARA